MRAEKITLGYAQKTLQSHITPSKKNSRFTLNFTKKPPSLTKTIQIASIAIQNLSTTDINSINQLKEIKKSVSSIIKKREGLLQKSKKNKISRIVNSLFNRKERQLNKLNNLKNLISDKTTLLNLYNAVKEDLHEFNINDKTIDAGRNHYDGLSKTSPTSQTEFGSAEVSYDSPTSSGFLTFCKSNNFQAFSKDLENMYQKCKTPKEKVECLNDQLKKLETVFCAYSSLDSNKFGAEEHQNFMTLLILKTPIQLDVFDAYKSMNQTESNTSLGMTLGKIYEAFTFIANLPQGI